MNSNESIEIEKLKRELQDARARNTEIIREHVEAFNRRENDIQKKIAWLKGQLQNSLNEIEMAHQERKAVLDENEQLAQRNEELRERINQLEERIR